MEKQQAIGAPQKSCGVEQQTLKNFTLEEWLKDTSRKVVDNQGNEIDPNTKTMGWLQAHILWFVDEDKKYPKLDEHEIKVSDAIIDVLCMFHKGIVLNDAECRELASALDRVYGYQQRWVYNGTWEPASYGTFLTDEEIKEIREGEYREGYMEGIKHIPVWNKCQAPGCEFDSFIYREEKGGDQWLYHKGYKIKLEYLEELPKEERL